MKGLLFCVGCLIPTLAYGQGGIPDPALRQTYERCVPACQETRSYAFCSNVCACATNELGRHWTAEEFRQKGAALGHGNSNQTRAEIGRLAAFCDKRISQ